MRIVRGRGDAAEPAARVESWSVITLPLTAFADTRPPIAWRSCSKKDRRDAQRAVSRGPTPGARKRLPWERVLLPTAEQSASFYLPHAGRRRDVGEPGLGQEVAPWQLPPGCCGVVGPVPSATRDKVRGTRGQGRRYGSAARRVKLNIFICRYVEDAVASRAALTSRPARRSD